MKKNYFAQILILFSSYFFLCEVANAQSVPRFEKYPERILARREIQQRLMDEIRRPEEGVVEMGRTWSPGHKITVAFESGSSRLHKSIAEVASSWSKYGNFTFDFGYDEETKTYRKWSIQDKEFAADIRVSFAADGYWSLVGTESIDIMITKPDEPSMNLAGFESPLSNDLRGTVLHEFGHAIGFHHEHQHPSEPSDFRWEDDAGYKPTRDQFGQFITDVNGRHPGVYTLLGGPPNEWNRTTVDFNLGELPTSRAYTVTDFDVNSIMKYDFDASMFIAGKNSHSYTGRRNMFLSDGDKYIAAIAYPDDKARIVKIESHRKKLAVLLDSLSKESTRSKQVSSPNKKNDSDDYADRLRSIRPRTRQFKIDKSRRAWNTPLAKLSVPRQELERIIDKANFLPANFMVAGANSQRYVGRIAFKASFQHPQAGTFFPGNGWGTGFMVSPSLLLTNNHVLENKAFSRDKVRVEFNYQHRLSDGQLDDKDSYDLDPEDFFFTDKSLDFTLVRVKSKQSINAVPASSMVFPGHRWSFYQLTDSSFASFFKDMQVNIIQHPAGRPKEIAIHNNFVEETLDNHIRYTTDTEGGSSGSPVFDNSWIVVALHHAAGERKLDGTWKNNQGVRIDKIIAKMKSSLSDTLLEELGID